MIGREEGREWPIVLTVIRADSPLHQHVQAPTSQWRKWEPKDTEMLLKLREAGFTQRQCMAIMRWSYSTIERWLKAAGVTCARRRWTEREKAAMVRLRAMGKSCKEIAKRLKRTPGAIKVAMSRYRQKVRNDPHRRLALRILAFCSNPGRVLKAIREPGIYTELKRRGMERRDLAL